MTVYNTYIRTAWNGEGNFRPWKRLVGYGESVTLGNVTLSGLTNNADTHTYGDVFSHSAVRSDIVKGFTNPDIVKIGQYAYGQLESHSNGFYLAYDGTSYVAITPVDGVSHIHNGRWIGNIKEGDTAGHMFIGGNGSGLQVLSSGAGVQARNGTNDAYTNMYAISFSPSSLRELKKNIEPFTENATELIASTPVYNYHFNEELDNEVKLLD